MARLYKAVHKTADGVYFSDKQNDFTYAIGKKAVADSLDIDQNEACGHGIHMAYLDWCLEYGKEWDVPIVLETLVFDEGQITCPTNGLNPQWGGRATPCQEMQEGRLSSSMIQPMVMESGQANAGIMRGGVQH